MRALYLFSVHGKAGMARRLLSDNRVWLLPLFASVIRFLSGYAEQDGRAFLY